MTPYPSDPTALPAVRAAAAEHPYPLAFATVSGAHLYGFPSADSDVDLRGVHLLPPGERVPRRRGKPRDTVDTTGVVAGLEVDLVTHDAAKFFALMLRPNGYVLEQVLSSLVVQGGVALEELRALAAGCVTRGHARHYLGFARTQRKLLARHDPPQLKPALYLYRILLTGVHLMETGVVEANLPTLLAARPQAGVAELIERKRAGAERETLSAAEAAAHEAAFDRLEENLKTARDRSTLPEEPTAAAGLDDLLWRLRAGTI
ncbi:DNA polymerase beta superfamily protein [Alienimonas sp. DA493]|uniref:nucleotidyltransferase domain-containing protein n=1 Tax=Alienimonas sp. DA493 TaxID=3373605 RepID=UPI0037552E26